MDRSDLLPKTSLLDYSEEELDQILIKSNRNLETLNKDLKTIKEWLIDQTCLPLKPTDRQIVSFLILNRFCLEKTKRGLTMFYEVKNMFPEFYRILPKDEEMVKLINAYNLFPLPKLSKKMNRIMFGQYVDANGFQSDVIFTLILQIHEIRTFDDLALGIEFILDYRNANKIMFERAKPIHVNTYMNILEKVFANRLSVLHVVNLSDESMEFIKGIISSLKPEVGRRFMLHENVEELLDYYERDLLPVEIGGTLKPVNEIRNDWQNYLQNNNEHFRKAQNLRKNEV